MSGEAGAALDSDLYALYLGSGRMVNVAIPPWEDGSYVGRYFESASQPFRRWLERARPELDALFARQAAAGIPIVPRASPDGAPIRVQLSGSQLMPNHESLQLSFLTARPVDDPKLAHLLESTVEVLRATQVEPEELPPPPKPSLWSRLFRGG